MTIAATAAISGAALAGNPAPLEIVGIAPVAVSAVDCSGPYPGASVSFNNGRQDYSDIEDPTVSDGEHYGVFAGCNFQNSGFVNGGELAYSMGTINWPVGYPEDKIESLLDVKARAGFTTVNILLYGVAAYTMGHYVDPPTVSINATGFSYGVGAEMKFGNRMFAGVEYVSQNIRGEYVCDPTYEGDFFVDSIQLRAGWQF